MGPVARLVTYVDIDIDVDDGRRMSMSARHAAELVGGRRVPLLDDRGWSVSGPADVWARTTVESIEDTARTVVGPDEPFGGRSPADMAHDHWTEMARRLEQAGVVVEASRLCRLPHDVVMSGPLLRRLGRDRGDVGGP